jgi:hypothetical protein
MLLRHEREYFHVITSREGIFYVMRGNIFILLRHERKYFHVIKSREGISCVVMNERRYNRRL